MSAWADRAALSVSRLTFTRLAMIAASLALSATADAGQRMRATGDLTSAEDCARCHQDIYRYWKSSMHAQAFDSPRFQQSFQKVRAEMGRDPGCLTCHAPAAVYMQDVRFDKKTSWEGVTCDFCHTVQSIRQGAPLPFVIKAGLVKTGPLKGAKPDAHDAAYSPAYTSSTICAPCHQYTTDKKFDLLTTYAEWEASPYPAKGTTCQSCHMRTATGNVVDPKIRRSASSSINVHEMPGGHSVAELNRALLAQVQAERRAGVVDVTVTVINRGAGHKVPTGSPLRAIVMVVEADNSAGARQTATRTFGRNVVDAAGQELTDDAAVFLRAARTVSDNRLAPGERRTERFSFTMPATAPVRALARFYYRYAPDAGTRPDPGTPFLSVSAWLDASAK
jgi:hypothetical protein